MNHWVYEIYIAVLRWEAAIPQRWMDRLKADAIIDMDNRNGKSNRAV